MSHREPRMRLYRVNRSECAVIGRHYNQDGALYCYSYFWRGRETFDYIRASDREHAKEKIRVHHPDARFYR